MLTPAFRIILILMAVAISMLSYLQAWYWGVAAGALIIVVVLVGHYRNGTVWLAMAEMHKGRHERARKLLGYVSEVHRLSPKNQALYALTKGFLLKEDGELAEAKTWLLQAAESDKLNGRNRAVAYSNLAIMAADQGAHKRAIEHLDNLRHLPCTPKQKSWAGQFQKELREQHQK